MFGQHDKPALLGTPKTTFANKPTADRGCFLGKSEAKKFSGFKLLGALTASVLAASSVVFVSMPASASTCASTTAPSGDGSTGDPYLISSAAELIFVSLNQGTGNFRSAEYRQTANIDLGGCDFTPIGSQFTPFSGVYNGNSKIISGLVIPSTDTSGGVGLFGGASGEISKLGIDGGVISGTPHRAGLLVGVSSGATISEVYVTGSISGGINLGGLVGLSDGSTITDSWADVDITGTNSIGGFVGSFTNAASSIARNYALGDITSSGVTQFGFSSNSVSGLETSSNFFKTSFAFLTNTSQGVGMNLDNFKVRANFTNFNFTTTWRIDANANGGIPYLAWQNLVPLVATTVGTDFWTTFGLNGSISENSRRLELYLSSESDTTATITFPSGATQSVNLLAGVTTTLNVTSQVGKSYNQLFEGVTNNGVRIQSNDPISVYGIHFVRATTDAWTVIPTTSLGYDYTVNLPPSGDSQQGASSNIQVVATEPGTTVLTVTPTVDMVDHGGIAVSLPDNDVVDIDKATSTVSLGIGTDANKFIVGDLFYLWGDIRVDNGDVGFETAAVARPGGPGTEPKLFEVTSIDPGVSISFVTNVDVSGITDTNLRVNGAGLGMQLMRAERINDQLTRLADNRVINVDPLTDTVTILDAELGTRLAVGNRIQFAQDLRVDQGDAGFTIAAMAHSDAGDQIPNQFTISAVNPGVSFSFVSNVDLSGVVDTALAHNSTTQQITMVNLAGTPITVELEQGQVYNLQVDRTTDTTRTRDISGTSISSNRKVGVIVSSFFCCTPEGTTGAYDQVFEQLVPDDRWGIEYLVPHGPSSGSGRDTLKIVARDNATQVSVNGSVIATLNAGETRQLQVTRTGAGVDRVTADKPISVLHVTTGSGSYTDGVLPTESGDPAIAVIPPVTQYLNSYVITTPASDFAVNAAKIIVKQTEKGQITRAGFAIGADRFTDIPNTDYAVGRIFIPLGTHYFRAPSGFLLVISGYDGADSYSYPGGFGLVDPVAYPNGVPQLTALQTATKPVSVGGEFISGTPTLCGTLTANEGSWLDGRSAITSTSYQWLRNGLPVSGATSSTLSLADFANGDLISFEIQKTNSVGTTTAFSAPVTITDALLTSLETTVGTLSPSFAGCTTSYTVNVVQDWLRITAGANSGTTIAITDSNATLLSGQSSAVQSLTIGANTRTLTATRNGITTSYTLNINYTAGPTVSMLAPSPIEETTATLRASANANGNQLSAASFEYSTAADFSGSITSNATFTTNTGVQNLSLNIAGLTAGQTYYVRASVTNNVGTVVSQSFQFTTKAAPRISSVSLARDTTIENEIDFTVTFLPNGSSTQLAVRWSLSPDLSNPTDVNLGVPQTSTSSRTLTAVPLSNLPAGALIYYELSVTNQFGTNYWPVSSFQLIGKPEILAPEITTTATTATLEFPVNPRGGTTIRICASYSLSTVTSVSCSSSQFQGTPQILDGNEFQTSRFVYTGLTPNTTYFVRALASNYRQPPSSGLQDGFSSNFTFTTQAAETLTSAVEGPASVGPNDSILLTFRFSQAITGFDKTDVVLSGATTGWTTQPVFQVEPNLFIMEIRPTGTVAAPSTLTIDAATPGTSSTGGAFPATNTLNIAVVNAAPAISYAGSPFTFSQYSAITPAEVTSTGGVPATFTVSPALPAGLSISNTGQISGTPTTSQSATSYTVTATNSAGSGTATISIETTASSLQAPQISYSQSSYSFERDAAVTNVSPTLAGGAPTLISISPSLPAGLSFNTSTGVISGTPTTFSTARNYIITASNGAGSDSVTLRIGTFEVAPVVSYSSTTLQFTQFQAITPVTATNSGGPANFSIASGTLHAGLVLNPSTGEISGTPAGSRLSANGNVVNITIRAANSGGFVDLPITVQILLALPSFTYASRTVTVNSSISSVSPSLAADSGGGINSYSISPALPNGMSINSSTGAITGAPSEIPAGPFTVTGTNAAGSSTATFVLTVNNQTPSFSYSAALTASEGVAFSFTPTSVLGADITFTITPVLPTGLSINSSTGAITGTPAAGTEQAATSYTVTGTNSSGSLNRTFTIAITLLPTITFSYPNATLSLAESDAITNQTPAVTVGSPNQWSVSPALPTGLVLDTATGTISGTPARGQRQISTTYTITGGDGVESSTFQVSIEITAKPIQFAYSNATLSLTENQALSPNLVAPLAGSVAPLTFSISPALPAGLTLNTTTGAISGTPAVGSEQLATTYTITGVDGLLSETATVSIVIAPQLALTPPQQQQNTPQVGVAGYSGPIITALSKTRARAGESMAAFGMRLSGITHIEIAGIRIEISELEDGRFVFDLPDNLAAGTHNIIAFSSSGRLIKQDALVIDSGLIQVAADNRRLNAGTFNNVVAIYAKGYKGQRLTAKVGEDWVIVQSVGADYVRIIERTRWIGKPLKVRIYINRKLVTTVDVVTK